VFGDVTKITDVVGGRSGQMVSYEIFRHLKEGLVERALGASFRKILM
jgi:hypothetical protein